MPLVYMRIRTTSNDTSYTYPYQVVETTTPPGSSVTTTGGITGRVANASGRWMRDLVTPNFRKLQAEGKVVVSPMLSLFSEREGTLVDLSGLTFSTTTYPAVTNLTSVLTGTGSIRAFAGIDQPLLSDLAMDDGAFAVALANYDYSSVADLESGLLARVVANAAADEGALSLVTAAELSKTADMLYECTLACGRLLTTVKKFQKDEAVLAGFARLTFAEIKLLAKYAHGKGKGLKLLRSLKLTPLGARRLVSLCGLWLGYRYGIMATYYDVMSWSNSISHHRERARFVSSQGSSYTSPFSVTDTSNRHQDTTHSGSYSRSTVSSAGCLVVPEIDGLHDLHGAGRVLSSAWELVPLSFVLDWLYDISTRIAALETSFLRPVVGSWIVHRSLLTRLDTVTRTGKTTIEGIPPNHSVLTGAGGWNATSIMKTKMVERKANPTVSYLPNIRVNLNWKRIADGVALTVVLRKNLRTLLERL